jgi:hypothetical protein
MRRGFETSSWMSWGGDGGFARAYADVWRRAGTVQVKRQWPVPTKAGKILPFHVIKR